MSSFTSRNSLVSSLLVHPRTKIKKRSNEEIVKNTKIKKKQAFTIECDAQHQHCAIIVDTKGRAIKVTLIDGNFLTDITK